MGVENFKNGHLIKQSLSQIHNKEFIEAQDHSTLACRKTRKQQTKNKANPDNKEAKFADFKTKMILYKGKNF